MKIYMVNTVKNFLIRLNNLLRKNSKLHQKENFRSNRSRIQQIISEFIERKIYPQEKGRKIFDQLRVTKQYDNVKSNQFVRN